MRSSCQQNNIIGNLMTACVLVCLVTGCNMVGPSAIRSGRLAYNEAILTTNNQQMLMAVIHNRYEESSNLLAVASVTANVSVTTKSGIQLGFGDEESYAGNLVPFSAGAVYEENPTISYTPVAGAKYMQQLLSPIRLTALAQFSGSMANPAYIYTSLVTSVNGIQNPDFLFSPTEPDPRFGRFVSIMTELTEARRLYWFEAQQDGGFSVVIDHYAPTYAAKVNELLNLLGLPTPKDPSAQVILPVSLALDGRDAGGIGIVTRSVWDLAEIMSAAVELPEADKHNGAAVSYPPPGLAGRELRIHHTKARPEHASVAVKHRDGWFYIDKTDQATKRFFRLMCLLWSITIAESTPQASAAPVLTVPVSK